MTGEINRDFYCSANYSKNGACIKDKLTKAFLGKTVECSNCKQYHRKWPTPEQFEKEYFKKYPDNAPVFAWNDLFEDWELMPYKEAQTRRRYLIVCANFWGKPADDWRPE